MPRHDQTLRQWSVWRVLATARDPLTLAEVRARAAPRATLRTLRRDVDALREAGAPVRIERRGRAIRYAVLGDGPPLRLDADTALALLLALDRLRSLEGTSLGDALDHLFRRLAADAGHARGAEIAALAGSLVVRRPGDPTYAGSREVLDVLRDALARHRVVALDYEDVDGHPSSRRVHPHALVLGPRGLYLHGEDERSRALRTFRVERIRAARAIDRAARAGDADPESYFAGSLGVFSPEHEPVVYRLRIFSDRVARLLRENPWHPSQRLEREEQGTWALSLELRSSRELLPRVLALGADAVVLEPEGLRAEVRRALREAGGRYSVRHGMCDRGPRVSRVLGRSRARRDGHHP